MEVGCARGEPRLTLASFGAGLFGGNGGPELDQALLGGWQIIDGKVQ